MKLEFIIAFLLLAGFADARTIVGISPPSLEFRNVLRNGFAEKFLTIPIDSDQIVAVNLQPNGEIADWLNLSNNITVSRGAPGRVLVSVTPPPDIPNGNYTGYIRVSTSAFGTSGGGQDTATAAIRAVVDAVVNVEITDIEVLQCSASGFSVRSAEKGDDVVFSVGVANNGNVRMKPSIESNVWDQDQITLVKSEQFKGGEILPTKQGSFDFNIKTNDMDIGQYWLEVEVPECTSKDTLTFDILEPGTLKSEGILKLMDAIPHFVTVGDTMAVTADFENTGEKEVEASFRGRITLGENIVQVIESEPQKVKVNELNKFTYYFTPKKVGHYVASGRVFYDKKRTFESSTTFEVITKRLTWKTVLIWVIYLVIIFIIAFLLYKIRKEKRRYLERLRSRY